MATTNTKPFKAVQKAAPPELGLGKALISKLLNPESLGESGLGLHNMWDHPHPPPHTFRNHMNLQTGVILSSRTAFGSISKLQVVSRRGAFGQRAKRQGSTLVRRQCNSTVHCTLWYKVALSEGFSVQARDFTKQARAKDWSTAVE